jgi:DNA-binding transcriptional LysR family regulator
MTTAFAIDASRFSKLLRLALVGDQPGEIVAAVAALKRALTTSGVDPYWLADAFERGAKSVAVPHVDDVADDRSTVWWCWHHRDDLTAKERKFIESLTRWRGPISERQARWLQDIADRLSAEVAA